MPDEGELAPETQDATGQKYFRIGEASRLTGTKAFVLRYWETEFPILQPIKSSSGHRLYRREDIETVFEIKRLLYEEGFTIAGARRYLSELNGENAEAPAQEPRPITPAQSTETQSRAQRKLLLDLHHELTAILTLLKRE